MDEKTFARFMRKVERQTTVTSPHVSTPCWRWTASTDSRGYGRMWTDSRVLRAHRLAYEHWIGPLGDLHCLHRCDEPACVNPAHLFTGTHADNMADMSAKGRQSAARGELNGKTKLTREDILNIREQLASGTGQQSLADQYGVRQSAISKIATRRTWAHA